MDGFIYFDRAFGDGWFSHYARQACCALVFFLEQIAAAEGWRGLF